MFTTKPVPESATRSLIKLKGKHPVLCCVTVHCPSPATRGAVAQNSPGLELFPGDKSGAMAEGEPVKSVDVGARVARGKDWCAMAHRSHIPPLCAAAVLAARCEHGMGCGGRGRCRVLLARACTPRGTGDDDAAPRAGSGRTRTEARGRPVPSSGRTRMGGPTCSGTRAARLYQAGGAACAAHAEGAPERLPRGKRRKV
jgi:hypothetical protein